MFKKLVFLNFLLVFIFISFCYAEAPNEIRYNGKLKEYKVAVDGIKNMKFRLYSQENGGNSLWEKDEYIKVSSGVFSYVIKPDGVDWQQKDIYLEIEIDGKRLEPREKLTSVPYSLHSTSAEHSVSADNITPKTKAQDFFVKIGDTNYYLVPKGAIIIWSGQADEIPAGWVLCDGTNGTPNLTGKFVLGAVREKDKKYSVGKSSGSETHTLTIEEMPSHGHKYTTPLIGNGGIGNGDYYPNEGHMKPVLNAGETITIGGDKAHNNMPPYYSLCYIMKK